MGEGQTPGELLQHHIPCLKSENVKVSTSVLITSMRWGGICDQHSGKPPLLARYGYRPWVPGIG